VVTSDSSHSLGLFKGYTFRALHIPKPRVNRPKVLADIIQDELCPQPCGYRYGSIEEGGNRSGDINVPSLRPVFSDLASMAIKFKDGVILGADSRTTTGALTPRKANVAHIQALRSQTESQINSLKSTTKFGVAEVDPQQTPKPSTISSNTTFRSTRTHTPPSPLQNEC
jgi:hypothetical protein